MVFNHLDFLELASSLATTEKFQEAAIRTAVSRAYYAAFLDTRERISRHDKEFQLLLTRHDFEVHSEVRAKLKRLGKISAANKLKELRLLRNQADYDLEVVFTIKEFKRAMLLARNILELVADIQ